MRVCSGLKALWEPPPRRWAWVDSDNGIGVPRDRGKAKAEFAADANCALRPRERAAVRIGKCLHVIIHVIKIQTTKRPSRP